MPGNIGDFKELVENSNGLFVDKSLFIKEIIDSKTDPLLITRPRRWGKTINMNMLFYFFVHAHQLEGMGKSKEFIRQCNDLFRDLKILEVNSDHSVVNYMRQHPVIYISFSLSGDDSSKKNENDPDWEKVKGFVMYQISELFKQFGYIPQGLKKMVDKKFNQELQEKTLEAKRIFGENLPQKVIEEIYKNALDIKSNYPEQQEIERFYRIVEGKPKNDAELSDSINFLTKLLYNAHNKSVYVLIDEYDSLINKYFDNQEILNKLTNTFSGIFSAFAKPTGMINDHIQKVIFTGILRVAKANIFSRLNNLKECTILDPEFSEYYGFIEKEVNTLLDKAKIINNEGIKNWYNGYTIGSNTIYNPWSIMRCIDNQGVLEPYWVDTADPSIIRSLLIERSSVEYKIKIRNLIKENQAKLEFKLKKHVSFDDLIFNQEILWSVLVHTGYLTLAQIKDQQHVRLPNVEIKQLITEYIDNWFTANPVLTRAANSLLIGDLIKFEEALMEILDDPAYSARIFSGGGRSANTMENIDLKEFIYQFLIMTELRCMNLDPKAEDFEVRCEPNDVSIGKTRPDFLIINHKHKLCVIGELKVSNKKKEDLTELAKNEALAQIERNRYGKKYEAKGYRLIKVGLAFKGKDFKMVHKLPEEKKTFKLKNNSDNKPVDGKRRFSTMVPLFQQRLQQATPTFSFCFKPMPTTYPFPINNASQVSKKMLNILRKIPKL